MAIPQQLESPRYGTSREGDTSSQKNYQMLASILRDGRRDKEPPEGTERLPYEELFPRVDEDLLLVEEALFSRILDTSHANGTEILLNGSCVRHIARPAPRSYALTENFISLRGEYREKYKREDEELVSRAKGIDLDNIVITKDPGRFGTMLLETSYRFFQQAQTILAATGKKMTGYIKSNLDDSKAESKFVEYEVDVGTVIRVSFGTVPTNRSIGFGQIQLIKRTRGQTRIEEELFAHHIGVNQEDTFSLLDEQRFGARLSQITNLTYKQRSWQGMVLLDSSEIDAAERTLDEPSYFDSPEGTVSTVPILDAEIYQREKRAREIHPPKKYLDTNYKLRNSVAELGINERDLLRMLAAYKRMYNWTKAGKYKETPEIQNMFRAFEKFERDELLIQFDEPYLFWYISERIRDHFRIPYFAHAKGSDGPPPWIPRTMLMSNAFHKELVIDPTDPTAKRMIISPTYMRNETEIRRQAHAWRYRKESGLRLFKAAAKGETIVRQNGGGLTLSEYDELMEFFVMDKGDKTYQESHFSYKGEPFGYASWRQNYMTMLKEATDALFQKYDDNFDGKLKSVADKRRLRSKIVEHLGSTAATHKNSRIIEPWDVRNVLDMRKLQKELHPLEIALLQNFALAMDIGNFKAAIVPPAVTADVLNPKTVEIKHGAKRTVQRRMTSFVTELAARSPRFKESLSYGATVTDEDKMEQYVDSQTRKLFEDGTIVKWYPNYSGIMFSPPSFELLTHLLGLEEYGPALGINL